MNIQITSRKFKAKDSLKDFITQEVNSLTKFSDEIIDATVTLSYLHNQNSIKTAEILLNIPGNNLVVSESTEEFEKSVTQAVEKLERQLKTLKSKKLAKVHDKNQ